MLEGKIISQVLGDNCKTGSDVVMNSAAFAKCTLSSNQMELKTGTCMAPAKVHSSILRPFDYMCLLGQEARNVTRKEKFWLGSCNSNKFSAYKETLPP